MSRCADNINSVLFHVNRENSGALGTVERKNQSVLFAERRKLFNGQNRSENI